MRLRSAGSALWRLPQQLLLGLVKAYRLLLSPSLGSSCRFEPTCSAYSMQALQQYGAVRGTYLTLHRLVRCGPWCDGGHDPVPQPAEAADPADRSRSLFSRLVTPVTSISSTKKPS
ncbi:MAG: membrane protein insertion efficiency factor YidD [Comamonadaceae bacterium]|nr:MAG: membrane protein insertion efficiency factor YidD [Comamonadaceae bacterium]